MARRLAASRLSSRPIYSRIRYTATNLKACVRQIAVCRSLSRPLCKLLRSSSSTSRKLSTATSATSSRPYSSETTSDDSKSFLTNEGVVEGIWMFIRHGDRAPSRPLCPPHRRDEEAAYWVTRLPYPDSATAFASFSNRFPLDILPGTNQGKFIDVTRNPFGFLTLSGLEQLRDTGHRFFNRYNHHGYHLPDNDYFSYEGATDFLDAWDVSVYSTNYLRTVMSVQSFLDGLLGTKCYEYTQDQQHRPFHASMIKEDRVPDHSWATGGCASLSAIDRAAATVNSTETDDALVSIHVRDLANDPLNAFDRNPDLIAELVGEVMLCPRFLSKDAGAAPLAARLANFLPGLVRPFRSDFSAKSPSGINWVEAADHFVCRQAHGVDLALFTDFEHDGEVEQTLAALAHQTVAHLAWRFRMWYENKRLLAAIAAPPLREISNQLSHTAQLPQGDKRPFVIYSCHDITILGLLYGMGADFLIDGTSMEARYWPAYASHLVFELVRIKDDSATDSGPTHVVRVLLNGKPVLSVDYAKKDTSAFLGRGPERLLTISDFEKLVTNLEMAGGHDYEQLLGRSGFTTR